MNPYKNLPDKNFWKRAVATIEKHKLDPATDVKFKIKARDKVITAGSCFAQHIARELDKNQFNYYVAEQAPELSPEERKNLNYGVFSARYGNLYTARQFLQLLKEASGDFQPLEKSWKHKDGYYVDPYRPMIQPGGFASEAELLKSRKVMLSAVEKMISNADVLVFTLGLTEAWRSKKDGAVFPLAPGVAAGEFNDHIHEFVNFNVTEVISDLTESLELVRAKNQKIKVILTVSPVPLIATYEDRHVLVSNTYSKSVLRVAAEELSRKHEWVQYFPSYEIITGNYTMGSYYEDDFREVGRAGVKHVMRCFLANLAEIAVKTKKFPLLGEREEQAEIVCDEEEIARIQSS